MNSCHQLTGQNIGDGLNHHQTEEVESSGTSRPVGPLTLLPERSLAADVVGLRCFDFLMRLLSLVAARSVGSLWAHSSH